MANNWNLPGRHGHALWQKLKRSTIQYCLGLQFRLTKCEVHLIKPLGEVLESTTTGNGQSCAKTRSGGLSVGFGTWVYRTHGFACYTRVPNFIQLCETQHGDVIFPHCVGGFSEPFCPTHVWNKNNNKIFTRLDTCAIFHEFLNMLNPPKSPFICFNNYNNEWSDYNKAFTYFVLEPLMILIITVNTGLLWYKHCTVCWFNTFTKHCVHPRTTNFPISRWPVLHPELQLSLKSVCYKLLI